jgi:tetratricopeptide (TPR) repeat protein
VKNQPSKDIFPVLLSLILVIIMGCATSPEKSKPPASRSVISGPEVVNDSFSDFPERYRWKAREDEKRGDLAKALKGWEVVKSFLPMDPEAGEKIARLKEQVSASADRHFKKGMSYFKSHSYRSARKEFLFTLYLKPDHAEAIQYLKEKLVGEDFFTYEVKKGDTIKEVARKIYKDPQKDFLIAYFNSLKIDGRIEPPMILKMPFLDLAPAKGTSRDSQRAAEPTPEIPLDIKEILEKTRITYQKGDYPESAALAEKALKYDPSNKETHELMNASYYQWGKRLSRERKYEEALEAFNRVDPGYKDINFQLAYIRKQLAEEHYLKGVKFFIEENIENAIQQWETTLSLQSDHPKAKQDIENARNLLQKLEKIK